MINVAVVNARDLFKYLVGIVLVIIAIIGITRFITNLKEKSITNTQLQENIQDVSQDSHLECLEQVIPGIAEVNKKEEIQDNDEEEISSDELYKKILQVELAQIDTQTEKTEEKQDKPIEEEPQLPEANTDVGTEIVTPEPIEVNATDTYGDVEIRNQTGYVLNEEMLTPNIEVDNSNIIIFHTHTCESYTPTEQNQYEPSGSYRTTDLGYSVARVGDELENYLSNYGYSINHDKTYHDYPAYTGSYSRSLKTVEGLEQQTPADVVIDLHRDAVGSNSNYAPTVRIGEDYCAQLMFVIGTDGGGLWHPNWNQNLKFAVKVQQKAEELYPGLFKPIILRNSRYNQHVSKAATIIEVGATGNTLEQSITSMKYLSKILDEVIK